ncbi:MAG: uroporphyrinogen-III C-methyltransferase [Bacteroidia bacterium]
MSKEYIIPKLTVVGTGPGDADLITVKGIHALSEADVVLYDEHVNTELLKYAPYASKKVFIGNRKGHQAYTQEQINVLVTDYAFTHGHVVRLKGGDAFEFENGIEEIEHARLFNIDTAFVPGLSGFISIAGLQQIPVFHRGISSGLWVLNAIHSEGKLQQDIHLAAKSSGTVIILSGLSRLLEIVGIYQSYEKGYVPVAVIQNGSLPSENIAYGSIDTIVDAVQHEGFTSSAIIIIGEVVRKNPQAAYQLALENLLFNQ